MKRDACWMVAGAPAAIQALMPLIEARRKVQRVHVMDGTEALLADPAACLPRGAEGVLVVGRRTRSPRGGLPGLFLADASGRRVPMGWLPDVGADLATYARAAAR